MYPCIYVCAQWEFHGERAGALTCAKARMLRLQPLMSSLMANEAWSRVASFSGLSFLPLR
jgi:hypothetical protein